MTLEREPQDSGTSRRPEVLRRIYFIGVLPYPLWHLLAPADAIDPWGVWWAVAASFAVVGLASLRSAFVERHLQTFFNACSTLVTLQLTVLASVNHGQPFYAIGMVMAILATIVTIQRKPVLLTYTALVMVTGVVLFARDFDLTRAAYWAGLLPMAGFAYQRLTMRETATRVAREHEQQLWETVARRTAQLTVANQQLTREMEEISRLEEELRLAQKMEAVGRLASGMAHEFNNLLTTINVYADLVLRDLPGGSPLTPDVQQIQKTTSQAASLIEQVLSFGRRVGESTDVLDLNELLSESAHTLQCLLNEDSTLERRLGEGPYHVRASRDQLEQVLINLALNARDAMPHGGTFTIETSMVRRDQIRSSEVADQLTSDEYVLLAVSDTGNGMGSEVRARAFDPFFTTKQAAKGTGLGLFLVYGIVNQAGGYVRVVSEPGCGACFELYLPASREAATRRLDVPVPESRITGRERILLVEDEDDLRRALHRSLSEDGYDVVEAQDGEAALKFTSSPDESFDLVITDVVMPGIDGIDLAHQIASAWPETKLFLVSGQLNHPALKGRELPPGLTLLIKPFQLQELRAKVREVLSER